MMFDGHLEAQATVPTGGAAVSATNAAGGPTTATVAAGAYFVGALCLALQTVLQASRPPSSGSWSVTVSSSGAAATGKVTISCPGTWSLSWTNTTLRDVLGFTGNLTGIVTTVTAPNQSPMVWFPDCPLALESDTARAPFPTDARSVQSPLGGAITLVGTGFYRHRNLAWNNVSIARTWEAAAAVPNASWETFLRNTQLGQGIAWFTPGATLMIYDHRGVALGADKTISGWKALNVTEINPKPTIANYTGLWTCGLPLVVSSG
jgi:hypothetical protein